VVEWLLASEEGLYSKNYWVSYGTIDEMQYGRNSGNLALLKKRPTHNAQNMYTLRTWIKFFLRYKNCSNKAVLFKAVYDITHSLHGAGYYLKS
jgi:hypothetical protein